MLEHGGRLRQAAKRYNIPLSDWLDLSTGINPNGWPVPAVPAAYWQRLPEDDDELVAAAQTYFQNTSVLPVAGSQAAIQSLPLLRPACRVGVIHPAYAEHAAGWQKAGHRLQIIDAETIDHSLNELDVLILINPNNPTGKLWQPAQLLEWHARLSDRGGWLIVDEAFMDAMPEYSLCSQSVRPGLIVLRSIGKFFGLAGIRCGFTIGEPALLQALNECLGPWTISNPGRYVAAKALMDKAWQQQTRLALTQSSRRLEQLLTESGFRPDGGCGLFQWLQTAAAAQLHEHLARQGIYTRLFTEPDSLRFGLPRQESDWQRLQQALLKQTASLSR